MKISQYICKVYLIQQWVVLEIIFFWVDLYCKRVFAKLSTPTKAKHGTSDLTAATSCSYSLRFFAVAAY